ncbi:NHL repeat-containing protein [candidate division KSB1 bacterium]
MKRITQTSILLISILLLFSTVPAQIPISEEGVSKDFKIVHNGKKGKWGDNPAVSLEFVKKMGDIEEVDDNLLFYLPEDIELDSDGNIYILDAGNHRIQKFNSNGNYIRTFGEEGQGPGEYMNPISIDVDPSGNIYIADQGNIRIQVLNPDGTNKITIPYEDKLGEFKLAGNGDFIMGGGGMISGGGTIRMSSEVSNLAKRLKPDGSQIYDYVSALQYNDFLQNTMGNRFKFTLDQNDNTYVSFSYQNRIEKYSPEGELLLYIDRELNYDVTKPKEQKAGMEREGNNFTVRMPRMNTVSTGIAVDDKGRIWVITLDRQQRDDEAIQLQVGVTSSGGGSKISQTVDGNTDLIETDMYKLEVYDTDGQLLGAIPLTHFANQIRIFGDRLFILDKYRGMNYYEYKIVN